MRHRASMWMPSLNGIWHVMDAPEPPNDGTSLWRFAERIGEHVVCREDYGSNPSSSSESSRICRA